MKIKNTQVSFDYGKLSIVKNLTPLEEVLNQSFSVETNAQSATDKYCRVVLNSEKKAIHYGDSKTKVLDPSEIVKMQEFLTEKNIAFSLQIQKLGEYSVQAKFSFNDTKNVYAETTKPKVNDVVSAAIIVTCSGDMEHQNGIDVAINRLVCSNGLIRTQTNVNASPELIEETLAKLNSQMVNFRALIEKKINWSTIQNPEFTKRILETGFQKKMIEQAHEYIAIEQEMQDDLNYWMLYNGLNKAMFENFESSLTYQKKKVIDQKLFELCLN